MIKEELEMVLNNKEAAKICADAAKMKLALQIKQAVEKDDDIEVMLQTWELFTTLVVARSRFDASRAMTLIMDLTVDLVERIELVKQMAVKEGIAGELGLRLGGG